MAEPIAAATSESLYRSELASAEERVRQLEGELRQRGGPRKPPPRPLTHILAGVGVSVLAMGIIGVIAVRGVHRLEEPYDVPEPAAYVPPPAPPSLRGAQWYTPAQGGDRTPILLDVNGDGQKDLLGLAWDPRDDEHALHAVAFDGKTHHMLWHSEGISTQWSSSQTGVHLDGQQLVVSDSRNEIRLIDVRTGKVDALTLAPDPRYAHPEPQRAGGQDLLRATPASKALKDFYPSEAHPAGELAVTIGWLGSGVQADGLIGWNRKTKAIVYEVPLIPETEERAPRSASTHAVDYERVYTAFVSAEEKQVRVVARSLSTGNTVWTTDVPGTDEGAAFHSMRSQDGQVFLAVEGMLVMLDAATGAEAARLSGF